MIDLSIASQQPVVIAEVNCKRIADSYCGSLTSPPALREEQVMRAYVLLFFLFKNIFSIFCQTNYLSVYQTDLHETCSIGRALAVDERSEVIFFDPSKDVAAVSSFVDKIDLHFTPTPCSSHDIR